jgi:hypothetical protein
MTFVVIPNLLGAWEGKCTEGTHYGYTSTKRYRDYLETISPEKTRSLVDNMTQLEQEVIEKRYSVAQDITVQIDNVLKEMREEVRSDKSKYVAALKFARHEKELSDAAVFQKFADLSTAILQFLLDLGTLNLACSQFIRKQGEMEGNNDRQT